MEKVADRGKRSSVGKRRRRYALRQYKGTKRALGELSKTNTAFFIVTAAELPGIKEVEGTLLAKLADGVRFVSPAVRAVANPEVADEAFAPDARAEMILRGIEMAQSDLAAAGGAYSLDQVQTVLRNVSRQRIERRVHEGSLLSVPGPSNRRVYPTIQFNSDGSVVEGLSKVRDALGFESPWAILNFLVNGSDALNSERPIDVLRQGDVERVVRAAEAVGVNGL